MSEVTSDTEGTKMSVFIRRRIKTQPILQLKNIRSHREDDMLVKCSDCGQLIKKKLFQLHSVSHIGRVVDCEEATIGMLDAIRRNKRNPDRCPEEAF